MPNVNGEPNTWTEANARKMDWYSPAPQMIIKYSRSEDKWKPGPRCQSWDGDSQCHNYALDKENRCCKAHGARPQALKLMEANRALKEQKQQRMNSYINHPDPDVIDIMESFASDEGRRKLEDEILAAKVAVAIAVKEMEKEAEEGEKAGFRNKSNVKMFLTMLRDIAALEESKVKVETAEQYVFNPTSLKLVVARLKNMMHGCITKSAEMHTSEEATDALTDVYKFMLEGFGAWATGNAGSQLPMLTEEPNDGTIDAEFRES